MAGGVNYRIPNEFVKLDLKPQRYHFYKVLLYIFGTLFPPLGIRVLSLLEVITAYYPPTVISSYPSRPVLVYDRGDFRNWTGCRGYPPSWSLPILYNLSQLSGLICVCTRSNMRLAAPGCTAGPPPVIPPHW